MKVFAFIHQNTPLGQILIQNEYDPIKEKHKVEIKFHSEKIGATLDLAVSLENEAEADSVFEGLKNLNKVLGFISEVIPNH